MLILISPSKTLDLQTPVESDIATTPEFLPDSRQLIAELKEFGRGDLKKLMKISDKIADLNYERFQSWKTPFPKKVAKQAVFAFKGDVYTGLDIDTFNKTDIKSCQKQLRILSGLYGLLKPMDLILPYRLEMGTRLKTKKGDNLYQFWGSKIADAINAEVKSHKSKLVVNLASNEYFKVTGGAKNIDVELVSPAFKEKKDGGYKMIGLFAKKARGMMSRYIIKNKISKLEDLKDFDLDGYRYNKKLSVDGEMVFTR